MSEFGRYLVIFGLILVAVGGAFWLLGRTGFRGLPGDIKYEGERVRIYFPLVTSLVISLLLTALLWLWQWFRNR